MFHAAIPGKQLPEVRDVFHLMDEVAVMGENQGLRARIDGALADQNVRLPVLMAIPLAE